VPEATPQSVIEPLELPSNLSVVELYAAGQRPEDHVSYHLGPEMNAAATEGYRGVNRRTRRP